MSWKNDTNFEDFPISKTTDGSLPAVLNEIEIDWFRRLQKNIRCLRAVRSRDEPADKPAAGDRWSFLPMPFSPVDYPCYNPSTECNRNDRISPRQPTG